MQTVKRIFLAVRLPDSVKRAIENWVNGSQRYFENLPVRFINPENWHITLLFFGDQNLQAVDMIARVADNVLKQKRPIVCALDKIVYGPHERNAKMIWVAGNGDTDEFLGSLQKELSHALKQAGISFALEERPFTTHITIARFKSRIHRLSALMPFPPVSFTIDTFDFLESELLPEGARYSILKTFVLKK